MERNEGENLTRKEKERKEYGEFIKESVDGQVNNRQAYERTHEERVGEGTRIRKSLT